MKSEMELVQAMEIAEDRDSELYINELEELLEGKNNCIGRLREQVRQFQQFRRK